jgi:4-hydroxy-4-methyl-2-oxoglutarate aldolase
MSKKLRSKIISEIIENRISTVEVCDILNKSGSIEGVSPLSPGQFAVGEAFYVYANEESNYDLHLQISEAPENSIVFIDVINCKGRAPIGDIMAKYLHLYRKVKAIVVNGPVRDAHTLIKEKRPIWCKGVTPIGCFNEHRAATKESNAIAKKSANKFNDSIIICDDSGIAIIPKKEVTDNILKKLRWIELQEDIWYHCIDTLKWDTYQTIAKKDYLVKKNVISEEILKKLKEFKNK